MKSPFPAFSRAFAFVPSVSPSIVLYISASSSSRLTVPLSAVGFASTFIGKLSGTSYIFDWSSSSNGTNVTFLLSTLETFTYTAGFKRAFPSSPFLSLGSFPTYTQIISSFDSLSALSYSNAPLSLSDIPDTISSESSVYFPYFVPLIT